MTSYSDDVSDGYPLLGEFEFRHYPSPRQLKRGELLRDVVVAINGPLGQELFALAEKTGLPFEIHIQYEPAQIPEPDSGARVRDRRLQGGLEAPVRR